MKNTVSEKQDKSIMRDLPENPYERILRRTQLLYGDESGAKVARRIYRDIEIHKQLRTRSVTGQLWTHEDTVLITYGGSIQSPSTPPLQTLRSFLECNLPEAFSMIHILPFFPWSSDEGFSITDYRSVDPALGTWEDIAALEQGYDLVIDLVLNHCSRENLWFIDFIAGQEPICNYFLEVDPDENLSMVTRPRSSPVLSGVRTHDDMKYVWTTFSNDQVDLNYQNPVVLLEFIDIMLYYFRRGARMVRLDAVAYLWKKIGTNCIHLPETHEIIKLFRDVLTLVEPGAMIMTEANVPHDENVSYFGEGDEAHVVYQFTMPPLLLHAIYSGETRYLVTWAKSLEEMDLPTGCTFLNFTASHDGIGLRPLEGIVPPEEVDTMLDTMRQRGGYVATRRNPDGTDIPYELNISYMDAFRNPDPIHNRWHIPMFLLSQIFTLSFKGIPAVYLHSLTATPNDLAGFEQTGITRSINRRKWDRAELELLIKNHESETGHVFHAYSKLLRIRKQQTAFHPDAEQKVLDLKKGLFGLLRTSVDHDQKILCLYNFTDGHHGVPLACLPDDLIQWEELICAVDIHLTGGRLVLPPYAAFWFSKKI